MSDFAFTAVELPCLNLPRDFVEGGDTVKAAGKQCLLVVDAVGLYLVPQESREQIVETRGIPVLVWILTRSGYFEEHRMHKFI